MLKLITTTAVLALTSPALAHHHHHHVQRTESLEPHSLISALMRDFSWTRPQAIGAVANLSHESGLRAIEQRGGGGGFGIAQWTGPRRWAFMSFARRSGMAPGSARANYGFLCHELRTDYAHVVWSMRRARTSLQATRIFAREYEGAFSPGAVTAMRSRYNFALQFEFSASYTHRVM